VKKVLPLIIVSSCLYSSSSYAFLDSLQETIEGIDSVVKGTLPTTPVGNALEETTKAASEAVGIDLEPETGKVRAGFSKDFSELNDLLYKGQFSEVEGVYSKSLNSPSETLKPQINYSGNHALLHHVQHASLLVDTGQAKAATPQLLKARKILQGQDNEGLVSGGGLFSSIKKGAGFITGKQDLAPYEMLGYEKVLMLNYQAISYLLEGKDKAYNVSKQAVRLQNEEREKFEAKVAEAEAKLAKEKAEGKDSAKSLDFQAEMAALLQEDFKEYHHYANGVEGAFVNPLGSYLSAMVMEFDAYENDASFDDAYRLYQEANALNKDSNVINKAVKDFAKWDKGHGQVDKRKRLLHVIVSDGFVPEKKVLVKKIPLVGKLINVQMPLMEPVESKVHKIKLFSAGKKKKFAEFSLVANTEAMAMRYQKDMEDENILNTVLTVVRSNAIQNAIGSTVPMGDLLGSALEDKLVSPDTRSWTNLPGKVYAARIHPSSKRKEAVIVSYDKSGKQLAEQTIKLDQKNNFVYVRSQNESMTAFAGQPLTD